MSLTDLMSGFDLAFYAQAALIVFFIVFVVVVIRAWRQPKDELSHLAGLPLDDSPVALSHSRQTNSKENE